MAGALTRVLFLAALAVPYLPIVLLGRVPGEGWLAGVWLALAGVAMPGAAGAMLPGGSGTARWFVRAIGAAVLLNVGVAVTLRVAGLEPGPRVFAALLGFATLTTGAWGASWGGRVPGPRREPGAWIFGVLALLFAAWMGTSVVPPLEDQDSEVQGTAFGLVHDLEPLCLTNRSTLYFFAHPPLLHALNAATLALGDDLEAVRPPYDAAVTARDQQRPRVAPGRLEAAVRAFRERDRRADRSFQWYHDVYQPFLATPVLTATRAPNFALAGTVAVLLFAWMRRLGASPLDASLVTVTYVTLPEIAVRSAYGGYYALTAATFLAATRLATGRVGGARSGYGAGVLAALANQKALVPGAAVGAWRVARAVAARTPRAFAPAVPLLLGLAIGTLAFWVWGLWIAPAEFVADHLLEHGVGRFSGGEVLTRAGKAVYPSRPALWLEFASHMGWGWTLLAGVAVAAAGVAAARSLRATEGSERTDALGTLSLWVLVGAVLFTLTDWRQTKHLCLLVPAASVALGWGLGALRVAWLRIVVRVALLASIAWNVAWIARLAGDFSSLSISTVW
ncbi:MAG: hypothetical protein KC591_14950 [Gemmatimonadetes bacterium]|nr:hypothetical protein [Gemmatimonadota bacterium]